MRILRRVEHDHRGSGGARHRRRGAPAGSGRPAVPARGPVGRARPEPRIVTGIAELDRVAGGGFVPGSATLIGGEPGIGKSTLLIQACAAVARPGGRVVYVSGEEFDRAGSPARRPARARRRAGAACGADPRRRHRGDARLGRRAEIRRHRFDPDHVERRDRIGAGHGEPGARLGAGAHPLRQGERRGAAACRPCHQGRPDRRPARRRAHGRRGLLLRGRRRARLPPAAGGQEPLRRDRRGRRLRNDRRRPRRGCRTPRRCSSPGATAEQPGRGGVRRRRRRAAAAGRDSGAGRADDARHAAPRGRRLGAEPAGHGPRGARGPRQA